jgi:hypothetical protein
VVLGNKTKEDILYYNSQEYAERRAEVDEESAEIRAAKRERAEQKQKEVKKEIIKLKRIFNKERCGEESMHLVLSLIERAAWLRVEINYIEKDLQIEGMMDFFVQGVQRIWREHPLSKMHVQHSKSYRETIKQLEAYGKVEISKNDNTNPLTSPNGLLARGNAARGKYRK